MSCCVIAPGVNRHCAISETAVAIKDSGQSYTTTDDDAASKLTQSGGSFQLPL